MPNREYRQEFENLKAPPPQAPPNWFAERGKSLERIISALLSEEGLDPRLSFRPAGEEIDGSFSFADHVYLLEAKWHKDPIPASDLYVFRGKVEGKLVGTLGVFISISDYSKDAPDALVSGKPLNLVLFNGADFKAALDRKIGFKRVLWMKLRAAAESGAALFPFTISTATAEAIESSRVDNLASKPTRQRKLRPALIVCEGQTDEVILSHLTQRMLREGHIDREVWVMVAGGKHALPRVAAAAAILAGDAKRAIVADTDGAPENTVAFLKSELDQQDWTLILPDPDIETSFASPVLATDGSQFVSEGIKRWESWMKSADLKHLVTHSNWLKALSEFLSSE